MKSAENIKHDLNAIRATLKEGVALVAVSKYNPAEAIVAAYEENQRVFGESREQELKGKHELLPKDIRWHFIGHLQTNKVRFIVPYVSMIETVDSIRLLREIEKQAARIDRTVDVLLELHLASEETKSGLTPNECRALLNEGEWKEMSHVRICGIMMMASNTDDETVIRCEFQEASDFFDEIKKAHFADADYFKERSYGMSGDYLIAQEYNSTMVRVGSAIFGERNYNI